MRKKIFKKVILLFLVVSYFFGLGFVNKTLAQSCLNDDGVCPAGCQLSQDNDCLIRGKGILYYTENTRSPFAEDNLPVPVSQKQTFENQMIKGADCTRYFDLTQREVDYFKDLGVDFVIVGYGPANWYNLAPTRPDNPRDFNDIVYKPGFATLDRWLSLLQRNNLKTVFTAWGTPMWASKLEVPLPSTNLDTAYPVPSNWTVGLVKRNRNWYLPYAGAKWQTNTLESAYHLANDNFDTIGVPIENIDTADFDPWEGTLDDNKYGYGLTKGDRYWYRSSGTTAGNWYTNTLENAYNNAEDNFETIYPPVPTSNLDAAYYDLSGVYKKGSYTVIKGDRYWYRGDGRTGNWYTNTLENAYNNVGDNFETISPPVPTSDLDAAYFEFSGAYVVIKGDDYWKRPGGISGNWTTGKLYSLYGFPSEWEANCEMANTYREFYRYSFSPANLNDFGDFMYAVASRYNGQNIPIQGGSGYIKVDTFKFWPEPNLRGTWQVVGRESDGKIKCKKQENGMCVFDRLNNSVETVVKTFVDLNNIAYDQIKVIDGAAQPEAVIWSPNILGGSDFTTENVYIGSQDFLNFSLKSDPKLKFDVFAIHAYPHDFNTNEAPPPERPFRFTMANIPNLIEQVNKLYCPGQTCVNKFAVSEFGRKSMIEKLFGRDYGVPSAITINGNTAADYLGQELKKINKDNFGQNGEKYRNMNIAVVNNTLYDPWVWWDTGLVNYYTWESSSFTGLGMNWTDYVESVTGSNFTQKNKKYLVFKNWISLSFRDFVILLKNYLASPLVARVDLNKDGKANSLDFSQLLGQFQN